MPSKSFNILVLPGDHIGPEIVAQATKILKVIEETSAQDVAFVLTHDVFGGASIDAHGVPITEAVLQQAERSDAVLFGAVGGPKWGARPGEDAPRPEAGVLALRKRLDCWANIRPCRIVSASLCERLSVIKSSVLRGTDFVVLRENCGGAYFGPKVEQPDFASDSWQYSRPEIERVARMAAYLARNYPGKKGSSADAVPAKITSCDKANVLASSRLWRSVVQQTRDAEFPDVELVHQLADSAAMIMITKPTSLNGVLLCDNTFGDILSDEAAVLPGSLGLLPSASLSAIPGASTDKPAPALYEPSHGSAPDLPRNVANPVATILSAGLMLRYTCGLDALADALDDAVTHVLDDPACGGLGLGTGDLGGNLGTEEMGDAIARVLKEKIAQQGL